MSDELVTGAAAGVAPIPGSRLRQSTSAFKETVFLPTSREEEMSMPSRRNTLQSVNKRKYPRPDLAHFSVYVPDPALIEANMAKAEEARLAAAAAVPAPGGLPSTSSAMAGASGLRGPRPTSPAPSADSASRGTRGTRPPQTLLPAQQRLVSALAQPTFNVSILSLRLQSFLQSLPATRAYNGILWSGISLSAVFDSLLLFQALRCPSTSSWVSCARRRFHRRRSSKSPLSNQQRLMYNHQACSQPPRNRARTRNAHLQCPCYP